MSKSIFSNLEAMQKFSVSNFESLIGKANRNSILVFNHILAYLECMSNEVFNSKQFKLDKI